MQQKKTILWLTGAVILFTAVLGISSCKKKFDEPPAFVEPSIPAGFTQMSIKDLKALHTSLNVENLSDLLGGDKVIVGVVNADDKSGNYYKQISLEDETGGITVRLDGNSLYTSYPVGRKLIIKLNGLFLGDYGGLIQLGGSADLSNPARPNVFGLASTLFDTYIIKSSFNNVLTPKVVTFDQFDDSLQSRLIQINQAEFAVADTASTYGILANGSTPPNYGELALQSCFTGTTKTGIIVRTSGYSSFAGVNAPNGNGTIVGIYTRFNTDKQLIIRDYTDVSFEGTTRCVGGGGGGSTAPFISIADVRAKFSGSPVTMGSNQIKGIVISDPKNISNGNIVIQDGNSGIDLFFGTAAATALSAFKVGDSLVIDITGGSLEAYNGMLELVLNKAAVPGAAAGTAATGSGKSVTPVTYTIAQIGANIATIENTLVTILNATPSGGTNYADAAAAGNRTLTDASGNMTLRTLTTASFANTALPTTCQNWVGYVSRFNTTNQIYIRTLADVTAGTACGVTPPPGSGITLTTSPFTLDFNGIGSGLPAGVSGRSGASASALGTAATFGTAPIMWTKTTLGFKNFASAGGTGITSTTDSATQANAPDRAFGLRQTSSTGYDPGSAFVFQIDNTTGKTGIKLDFDLQSLDATGAPRTVTWKVDYGIGDAPTTFTVAPTATGTFTTGNNVFSNNAIHAEFGGAIDNQTGKVWIRVVTLTASTGSGNRASTAVDNFKLSW